MISVQRSARALGIVFQAIAIGLYGILDFFNPYVPLQLGQDAGPLMTSILQVAFAVLGIVVSWAGKPILMLGISALEFIPAGCYLLGTPGIFRWIGILDVLYGLTAIFLWMSQHGSKT